MQHPMRYPKHEGDKGTKFDGACNRTACDGQHAVWFNLETYGYYCQPDAFDMNAHSLTGKKFLIRVDHDLTIDEMNAAVTEYRGY